MSRRTARRQRFYERQRNRRLWSQFVASYSPPEWLREDEDGVYLGDCVTCWKCGGEGAQVDCCDDLCHGQDWCMHGDNSMCPECHGEGVL